MAKGKNNTGTTLNDIQFALQGEQPQQETFAYIPERAQPTEATPQHEYVIYKLVNTKKKGRVYIDGIDDVINPKTGRMERIVLLTGAHSIWASELTELLKDKDYVRRNRRSLLFEGGVCRIPTWDKLAIEWIGYCRHFIDNPSRRTGSKFEFFEYNPQKIAQVAMEREMLELDMAIAVKEMNADQVQKLASYFNISFIDELGRPKVPDAVRRELMLRAKKDPVLFKKTIGSRDVEINYLVTRAILDAKIDLAGQSGAALWAGTGGFITRIPLNRKPKDYLVELASSSSEEGRQFFESLSSLVR